MDEAGIKPSDIKSIDDLKKLPFKTKHYLRENYPYGFFATSMDNIVRIHASSGTTGTLTTMGYTKRDLDDWSEAFKRSLPFAGVTKSDMVNISYGYGLFTGGLGAHYGAEALGCAVVPCSTGNTSRQLQLLKDFKATVLCCTPSYALVLAEAIEKSDEYTIEDSSHRIGIFGAEPWSEGMKAQIEEKLHIKAYDIYCLSEISGPGVSMNCGGRYLHVQEDYFYPEIIDPETFEVLLDGVEGELVFTTLRKEGVPLIRYRTRDLCSLYHGVGPICGRTLVRMDRVKAGSDDMLIIRGVNVFPSQIENTLTKIKELNGAHYLLVVDRMGLLDPLEINVELNPAYFTDTIKDIEILKKSVEHMVTSAIGIAPKSTFCSPGKIPLSDGKTKRTIYNRKI
jgi:phenylacetate-CoA ligase